MTSPSVASPHHPNPLRTGSAREDDSPCVLCGRTDPPKYEAAALLVVDDVDEEQLCIQCIVTGDAHEKLGAEFTTHFASADGWDAVPAEMVAEIRERTPAVFTWQSPRWLACCGRPGTYLGVVDEAGAAEVQGGVDAARVDALVGPAGNEPPSWYVFRCERCASTLVFDDAP